MPYSKFNFSRYSKSICTNVDIGFDFALTLTYNDPSGDPIDLTGYSLSGIIRSADNTSTKLVLGTAVDAVSTGFFIETPSDGVIQFIIAKSDTLNFTEGNYPYEFTLTAPSGLTSLWMYGLIDFSKGSI
jgi:hypothetical protein